MWTVRCFLSHVGLTKPSAGPACHSSTAVMVPLNPFGFDDGAGVGGPEATADGPVLAPGTVGFDWPWEQAATTRLSIRLMAGLIRRPVIRPPRPTPWPDRFQLVRR